MANPTFIGSISGPDGFDICYVSFKELVASKGALQGTPTVVSATPSLAVVSNPLLTFAGTVNGVTYAADEMLTFTITAQKAADADITVNVAYESAQKKGEALFRITQEIAEAGVGV